MSVKNFMVFVHIIIYESRVNHFILHQGSLWAVIIEVGLTENEIVFVLMLCNFGKGKKLRFSHQGPVLRSNDLIKLFKGIMPYRFAAALKYFRKSRETVSFKGISR